MSDEQESIWEGMNYPRASVARQKAMGASRGRWTDGDAVLFAPIMAGMASEEWKSLLGLKTMDALHTATAEQLEEWFAKLLTIKRRMEDPKNHRSTRAVCAFWRYQQEHGRKPTKGEFKRYLIENPKAFGEFPDDEADSAPIWSIILNCPELRGRFRRG